MTYTIFIAWVYHDDNELNMHAFPSDNREESEKGAKRWLYITARTFLNDELPNIKTENELSDFFVKNTLDNVISFIHENSESVTIKYKTLS